MDNRSIRKLESELWESADLLRAGSKLTSNQYCMFEAMNNLANGAAQQNLSPIRTGKLEALFPRLEIAKQFEKP